MLKLIESLNILINKIEKLELSQPLTCYTVKEVAEKLKASENSVYNMIESGVLEAFKIGTKESKKPVYRISRDALERFMGKNTNINEVHNG